MSEPFIHPENLAHAATVDPGMAAWTPYAEQRVRDVAERWSLTLGLRTSPVAARRAS